MIPTLSRCHIHEDDDTFLKSHTTHTNSINPSYLEELEKGNAASVGRVEYNPVNIQPSTDGRRPRSRTAAETFEYPLRSLEIRQNANNTVYVKNLSIIQVNSVDEVGGCRCGWPQNVSLKVFVCAAASLAELLVTLLWGGQSTGLCNHQRRSLQASDLRDPDE